MKYKVTNLTSDMKFMRDGAPVVIRHGQTAAVSLQEYQYLSQVYGAAVRGEKDYTVRTTKPVKIDSVENKPVVQSTKKKRKNKKS